MNSLLSQLSVPDLLQLAGLGDKPVLSTSTLSGESFEQCLEWIAGRRRWRDIARETHARHDLRRAWAARARALAVGELLPSDLDARLQEAWLAAVTKADTHRKTISALPPPAEAGDLANDVLTIKREVALVTLPGRTLPSSPVDVEAACDSWAKLEKLAGDAEFVILLVAEQASAQRKTLLESARQTTLDVLDRLERQDSPSDDRSMLTVLRALPELIRDRDLRLIDRIRASLPSMTEEFTTELADRCRISASPARDVLGLERVRLPMSAPPIQLTAAAQTLFSAETPATRGITSSQDLDEQLSDSRVVVDQLEVGTRWMRIARATTSVELQRLALGHGLAALSRAYLDHNQSRLATELARDAVASLCLPEEWFRQDLFDSAAITLVATRVWARMNLSALLPGRPSELVDRPALMFDWMRDHDAVEIVSELWADLPDDVDDCFFQVLKVHFAHATELRHACAESALTAHRLRSRPMSTTRRVLRLLDDATRTEPLVLALHACGAELEAAPPQLAGASRQILVRNAEAIRKLLAARTEDPIAQAIGGRLCDLLVRMASVDGPSGDPKLTIAKAVNVFYPKDRSDDVWLPITVTSDRTGGPSPEMSLQVNFEGPNDSSKPEIEWPEFVIPPLSPGESHTGHALLQLNERTSPTTWQFRATLLRGAEVVLVNKFHVDVKERRYSRPNPFSAGQAVQEDQFFIGREKQLRMLLDALIADRRDITLLIVGQRRIGKTSLLKYLLRHKEVLLKYTTDFWDTQDLQRRSNTTHFLFQLATRVRAKLPESHRHRVRVDHNAFKEDPYASFEEVCDAVSSLDLPKLILIGIDEFEHIVALAKIAAEKIERGDKDVGPSDVMQPQTLGALRKMLMKGGAIRLLLSGLPEVLAAQKYDDRLFGLVHRVEVGPFLDTEANRVVAMADGYVAFPPKLRQQLYDVTGLQPYLLQLLCNSIYSHVSTSGRDEVTSEDLQEVIERDIVPHENYFKDYVALIRVEDRALLRALALAQKAVVTRRRFVTPGEVVHELWKSGESRANVHTVSQHLRALAEEERPLVAESGDNRGNFRLIIGLLSERLIARGI